MHKEHHPHHRPFGADSFGAAAEKFARAFGTPKYLIAQTIIVIAWILMNTLELTGALHFDKPPYIGLNLIFSTQAAYAAPLILLAQTRQADRDKRLDDAANAHREEIAQQHREAIDANTALTEQINKALKKNTALTAEVKRMTEAKK